MLQECRLSRISLWRDGLYSDATYWSAAQPCSRPCCLFYSRCDETGSIQTQHTGAPHNPVLRHVATSTLSLCRDGLYSDATYWSAAQPCSPPCCLFYSLSLSLSLPRWTLVRRNILERHTTLFFAMLPLLLRPAQSVTRNYIVRM
jgi:hypothetical protein